MKTLDYSFNIEGETPISGIVTDAIGIKKYWELGNPEDAFYPSDGWEGMPAIIIERQFGENIELLFYKTENRNEVYGMLSAQFSDKVSGVTVKEYTEALQELYSLMTELLDSDVDMSLYEDIVLEASDYCKGKDFELIKSLALHSQEKFIAKELTVIRDYISKLNEIAKEAGVV